MKLNPARKSLMDAWRERVAALTPDQRRIGWLLFFITLLGAALRLYRLGYQALWYDEATTWVHISSPSLGGMLARLGPDWQQPLHFILLYATTPWLGASEFALRLPSALAGTLAIPAGFLLGRRMFGTREGLLAAALLAVLRVPIFYSQEARAYAWLMLLSILSAYYWWHWVQHILQGLAWPRRSILLYLLFGLLAAYTHAFGLVVLLFQAVWVGWVCLRHGGLWRAIGWNALVIPGYALWWAPLLAGARVRGEQVAWDPPNTGTLIYYFKILFNNSEFRQFQILPFWIGMALVAAGLLLTLARSLRVHGRRAFWPLAFSPQAASLWMGVAPMLFLYVYSIFVYPVFSIRYPIGTYAFIYMLAAHGLLALPVPRLKGMDVRAILAAAWVAFLLFDLFAVDQYYFHATKQDSRAIMVNLVDVRNETPDAYIVVCADRESIDYYLSQWGIADPFDERLCYAPDYEQVDLPAAEARALAAGAPVFAIGHSLRGTGQTELDYFGDRYCRLSFEEFLRGHVAVFDLAAGPDCP
ncbi:MAG: hypothetical protein EPO32_05340 [Anaerolineae bacterium]|nr:MAG: hypothetical protein EPO32_05340 [Anaerolineae bacterium]